MTAYYIDKEAPDLGSYEFFQHSRTREWQWTWREVAKGVEYTDDSTWFGSLAEAMRDAANDWESNGNSSNRRFAGMLRGLAAKEEKRNT